MPWAERETKILERAFSVFQKLPSSGRWAIRYLQSFFSLRQHFFCSWVSLWPAAPDSSLHNIRYSSSTTCCMPKGILVIAFGSRPALSQLMSFTFRSFMHPYSESPDLEAPKLWKRQSGISRSFDLEGQVWNPHWVASWTSVSIGRVF